MNSPERMEYGADPMAAESTLLMTRAKHGDRAAFETLVEKLRGRAFRIAQSLVGSREDALELAQEAFFKTYRARESYRDHEPFLPWFHQILRNTCYSFLRTRSQPRPQSISGGVDAQGEERGDLELIDDKPAPIEPVLASERARLFWKALKSLPARDREVLSLRHFQELSYQAIANEVGIPIGTVMSRLFHARRRLRDALEVVGGFEDFQFGDKGGRG